MTLNHFETRFLQPIAYNLSIENSVIAKEQQ